MRSYLLSKAVCVPLTLTITSHQRQSLGSASVKVMAGDSLTIGRSPSAGWTLPDPQAALSREHVRVQRQGSDYILTDLSQNGTFVNDSPDPVSHGKSVRLSNGDRIQLGDYQLAVGLEPTAMPATPGPLFPSVQPAPYPSPPPSLPVSPAPYVFQESSAPPWPGVGPKSETDPLKVMGGDHRATNSALGPYSDQRPGPPDRPRPSMLQDNYQPPNPQAYRPPGGPEDIPDVIDFTTFERDGLQQQRPVPTPIAPPIAPPSPAPQVQQSYLQPPQPPQPVRPAQPEVPYPAPQAAAMGIEQLLLAAGLDPAVARAALRDPQLAEALGQIFQVALNGIIDVLRARAHIKQQFRLTQTQISAHENNPLKFSPNAAQALSTFFVNPAAGFLSPLESVDEAFADIKAHQMAVLAGMRAAFDHMFARFNPEKLQERFDKGRSSSMLGAMNKARYWEEFNSWYGDLAEDRERGFQRLFGEEFAKAYEQQMQRIAPRGRRR